MCRRAGETGAIQRCGSGVAAVDLSRLDEPRGSGPGRAPPLGCEITRQISNICFKGGSLCQPLKKSIDWKAELRAGRIRASVIYSNPNRRRAEQVEAALQQWDLAENQPRDKRFSLHQSWAEIFAAKPCAGHVLLVEVTQTFFHENPGAVFVVRGKGKRTDKPVRVGKGGEVR